MHLEDLLHLQIINDFGLIAASLHSIIRNNVHFNCNDKCRNAFANLKASLTSSRLFQYPDFSTKFIITLDASKIGYGAVLSQDFKRFRNLSILLNRKNQQLNNSASYSFCDYSI